MAIWIALHDRRLNGGVPRRRNLRVLTVDGKTPLINAFHQIRAEASVKKVHSLFILCHGFAGIDKRARVSLDAGGMGLQLGQEGVTHQNVSMWAAIRGKVTNVVVYACAAGDTQPGSVGTSSDGRYLMGALAIHIGADVYAADRIQWFSTYKHGHQGRIDFGNWEGRLLKFGPGGGPPQYAGAPPTELSQVMAGPAI
jgi:hypothetical protein